MSRDKNSITVHQEVGIVSPGGIGITTDKRFLREFWHDVLRSYGSFPCSAVFLLLPSDEEAFHYLTEYGKELDIISGENCLVLAFSESEFKDTKFSESNWRASVEEHTGEGFSAAVARLFDVDFTQFPSLLLFRDIRNPEHILVELKEMSAKEIATTMRSVFSIIDGAIKEYLDPLTELDKKLQLEITREGNEPEGVDEEIANTLWQVIDALQGQDLGLRDIVIRQEIIGGDKITIRDIVDSKGVAIGREAQAIVTEEKHEEDQ